MESWFPEKTVGIEFLSEILLSDRNIIPVEFLDNPAGFK